MNILHDKDADLSVIQNRTVAVIGYGSQGAAQALCMRDSGVNVIIGSIKDESYDQAVTDGFEVMSIAEAAARGAVVHLLLPDELHRTVYEQDIRDNLKPNAALSCSHGFNLVYNQIVPAEDKDVIMVAPKSPGSEERKAFLEGFGVPGLIAVKQDATGNARDIALSMARSMGFTRAGCLECSFEDETFEDLFGEQTVLCGGLVELMKAGFEVLTEKGYPPEMAYFECVHEVKLIVDLIYQGGIQHMNSVISNTAEWGEYQVGPKVIGPEVKERMREALQNIEDGTFAREWIEENRHGAPNLLAKRQALGEHQVEKVGAEIRNMFEREQK